MTTIEVLDTDITQLEVDAIANTANTDLLHGGAVRSRRDRDCRARRARPGAAFAALL